MNQTHPNKSQPTDTLKSSGASSTSTSSGDEPREAASRLGAIAGNPTAEEAAKMKTSSKKGVVDGHEMKKRRHNGKDFWQCEKCSYSTSKPESANEHEKAPY